MDNGRHKQLDDLSLLSKIISTCDGSSNVIHDEPASLATTTQEVYHTDGKGVPGDNQLEMKEIKPKDIDAILHLSGVRSSSFADAEEYGNGQVLDGIEGESAELESDLSTAGEDPAEIVESSHIWYACYGSNLYKPRFMCYIEGGKIEGMGRSCRGCRDKSPPVASDWLCIPNRLFFGHKSTKTWGLGGVAFINPIPEPGVVTHVRIYKITMEQFNDVISQENAGKVERNWIHGRHINQLKKEPHHLMEIIKGSWYGTVKFLGEKDGLPILTFTCPESHMEKFRSGEFGTFAPAAAYRNVIVHDLVEDFGFTEEEAHNYVSSAILPKKESQLA